MRNRNGMSRRHNTMKPSVVLLALALLTSACAIDDTPSSTVPDEPDGSPVEELAALGNARAAWQALAPADYTFTATCDGCTSQTVAVRSGEIVSLASQTQTTVDDVFEEIEAAIRGGADVQVSYDVDLGYPIAVSIDTDRDGLLDVDSRYDDLEAMPIVTTLEELLAARQLWEALGLKDYRYLFRADCTCSEEGTFEVTVRDGRVTEERPLDEAAQQSRQLSPGSLDAAFDDLEDWFTDSAALIDEGILEVDVRMDPQFGYPRWFRVVAEGLDSDGPLAERFEIVVTTDLIGPIEKLEGSVDQGDLAELAAASSRWTAAGLTDYRYAVEYHCECPVSTSGPFEITIRNGQFWSAAVPPGGGFQDSALYDALTIDQVLDLIDRAIQDGTDVEVVYDGGTGQPLHVMIDPEAVAVDGGLAFSITPLVVLAPLGFLDL
ncbi:MAG: DUF6174 domain-containing protein, partial [Acidimicrobiia bacterium]|nr:DUF6174 domain-containing protein [Acidimicrobiia bacterium]